MHGHMGQSTRCDASLQELISRTRNVTSNVALEQIE